MEQKKTKRAYIEDMVRAFHSMKDKAARDSRKEQKMMLEAMDGLVALTEANKNIWDEGDGSTADAVVVGLLREAMTAYNFSLCPPEELSQVSRDNEEVSPQEFVTPDDFAAEAQFLMGAALAAAMAHTLGAHWNRETSKS